MLRLESAWCCLLRRYERPLQLIEIRCKVKAGAISRALSLLITTKSIKSSCDSNPSSVWPRGRSTHCSDACRDFKQETAKRPEPVGGAHQCPKPGRPRDAGDRTPLGGKAHIKDFSCPPRAQAGDRREKAKKRACTVR
eukprot:6214702-Pleurochrysis_carterae.AAC.2